MIRKASAKDIDAIVRIHEASFRGFFLTELGWRFLRKYYRALIEREGSVFLVSVSDEVDGFVCGISAASYFNRAFVRKNLGFILAMVALAALRKPSILVRAVSRPHDIGHFPDDHFTISLLSIAVSPDRISSGIGSNLIDEFIDASATAGFSRVYLTTDRGDRNKANEFYAKNGFRLIGDYDSGNRRIMREYIFEIAGK